MISEVAVTTSTALGAGAAYTSPKFPCDDVSCLVISCYSNKAGSLVVQQSHDGTNFDISETHAYTALAKGAIEVNVTGKWAQLVYTNGGDAQTTFRLSAAKKKSFSSVSTTVSGTSSDVTDLMNDVGDASGSTLGSIYAILGNPASSFTAQLAAIAGYIDTEVASILAAVDTEIAALTTRANALGLTTFGEETAAATDVNGTTWKTLLDKSTLTSFTELWSIKVTKGGTWAGTPKLRIVTGAGTKIFPFGDEGVEGTDFIDTIEWPFPAPVCVPAATGYIVQFRSSDAGDGAGETLTLNSLGKIERT